MKLLAILTAGLSLLGSANASLASEPDSGLASWYGEEHRGKTMANGQPFSPDRLTCATWQYRFGQVLRVTNVKTGKSVVVICTDRGPNRRFKPRRCVDLSRAAFRKIADLDLGVVPVKVEPL